MNEKEIQEEFKRIVKVKWYERMTIPIYVKWYKLKSFVQRIQHRRMEDKMDKEIQKLLDEHCGELPVIPKKPLSSDAVLGEVRAIIKRKYIVSENKSVCSQSAEFIEYKTMVEIELIGDLSDDMIGKTIKLCECCRKWRNNTGGFSMNIYEFADVIDKEIVIRRYSNQNNRFMAKFEHSETKKNKSDCILSGSYGNGNSPEEALSNYMKEIQGKVLIFNAMSDKRQEYVVPNFT